MPDERNDAPAPVRCGACGREVEDESSMWPEVHVFEEGSLFRLVCEACAMRGFEPAAERRGEPEEVRPCSG